MLKYFYTIYFTTLNNISPTLVGMLYLKLHTNLGFDGPMYTMVHICNQWNLCVLLHSSFAYKRTLFVPQPSHFAQVLTSSLSCAHSNDRFMNNKHPQPIIVKVIKAGSRIYRWGVRACKARRKLIVTTLIILAYYT